MSTLEKTINLLNTMPEYQLENIYSYARFLHSQSKSQKEMPDESIDQILDSLVGVISDDGKTLEEYRGEGNVMDLLIDTNIILDMVLKREKYQLTVLLFKTIENIGARAYITATTVTDLFYIIQRQTHNAGKTYTVMRNIFKIVSVLSVTNEDVEKAFEREWKDFEDSVQYTTAENNQMDYIITSNIKDFENNEGYVLLPEQWITQFTK